MPDTVVADEIKRDNLWYTGGQLETIDLDSMSRGIRRRWEFFTRIITDQRSCVPDRPLKILDAGCGDGVNLKMLSGLPNVALSGVDYNPLRVERAQQAFPQARVSQGDLTNLRLRERFDVILCSQVIEHIADDEGLLRNLASVLMPAGVLILGTPNEGCLLARLRNHILERSILRNTDHVHFYTERSLRKTIERSGLDVVERMLENLFFPRQAVNNFFASRDWGFRMMQRLHRIIPSQAAGYYFVLRHRNADAVTTTSGAGTADVCR